MIVTLDGQRIDEHLAPETTLHELLEQVRVRHLDGRLIISVALNGRTLDDDALRQSLPAALPGGQQLDLESSEPRALVADALRGLALEFDGAPRRYAAVAEQIRAGEVHGGIRAVGEFVQLWQTCHRTISQCNGLLGKDLTEMSHGGQPVRGLLENLIEHLTELRAALESQDLVTLSDVLRYELLPFCATWRDALNDLADQLHAHPTRP